MNRQRLSVVLFVLAAMAGSACQGGSRGLVADSTQASTAMAHPLPLVVAHEPSGEVVQASAESNEQLPPQPQPRLNVLLIAIDDLNTYLLGDAERYAGRVVAPNIQGFSQQALTFTRAYTACPVCSPSRAAMLSGIAPWNSGAYGNALDLDGSDVLTSVQTIPQYFRANGYYSASYGKIAHGWPRASHWDNYISHTRDPHPPTAPLNGWAVSGTGKVTSKDWGPTHLDESEMNDTQMANHAIADLQQAHDKPFFLFAGIFHPHFPWYVPQKYFDMYPLDSLDMPAILPEDQDDLSPIAKRIIDHALHGAITKHDQLKQAMQAYLANITYADVQVGRILAALDASPYRDNTIVIMMSDHGFHIGEKGHIAKAALWERATNCVLMIRMPDAKPAGVISNRPVSLLDIYPTVTELTGLPTPKHVDGRSLVPLLQDQDASWPYASMTAFEGHITVRTQTHRLIRYSDGARELYDHTTDPHEWQNQIQNPEYATVLAELEGVLPAPDEMAPMLPFKSNKSGKKLKSDD